MSGEGGQGGQGGPGGELAISREAIKGIVTGMKSAIGELEKTGSAVTESNRGAGFENLVLTSKEAGTGGLAGDFEGFCERWEWGVRALMTDANDLAEELGLAVGVHHMNDKYWETTFKYAANTVNPGANPGLSRDEVAQQDWGEIAMPDAPEYSRESMDKAMQEAQQQWADPDAAQGIEKTIQAPSEGGER